LGCRWIAEVHDPMVVPGQTPATRDARMLAWIERKICESTDLAWWFTDNALASARTRHPALAQRGITVLPGADPPLLRVAYTRGEVFTIGHFGSLSTTRSLAPAVQALGRLVAATPALRSIIRLEVYGGAVDPEARRLIESLGLADVVKEMGRLEQDPVSGRSGRERVIERMQQVDVLLLMHGTLPDCAEYIPSKLYDYFWGRRPVLALTHQNPQLDALVREHGGRAVATTDIAAVERTLLELVGLWRTDSLPDVTQPPITVALAVGKIVEAVRRAY
jgi:glycosyltransferase involved in cell wall biosynthesis